MFVFAILVRALNRISKSARENCVRLFCAMVERRNNGRVSRKLRPRKLRPQTSDPENSDPENSEPENSDPENSEPENSDPENSDPSKLKKNKTIALLWSRNVHMQQLARCLSCQVDRRRVDQRV